MDGKLETASNWQEKRDRVEANKGTGTKKENSSSGGKSPDTSNTGSKKSTKSQ